VELRNCRNHGLTEFAFYSAGKEGRRWRCKRCVGEAVTRRHQKVRKILITEAGGRCAICGYGRAIVNLHFHHVNPALKSFSITSARGKSLAAYRDEAKKCVLVCANCHGEIESGVMPSPPPGTTYR
jgi:phage baseplate assembly protein W